MEARIKDSRWALRETQVTKLAVENTQDGEMPQSSCVYGGF